MTSAAASLSPQDIEATLQRARQALRKNPRDTVLHANMAVIYEQTERHAEAVPHLAVMLESSPVPEERLYGRYAYALQRAGNFPQAQAVLEQGLKRYPNALGLLKDKAKSLWLLGRYEEARQEFLALAEKEPEPDYGRGMAGYMGLLASGLKQGFEDYGFRPDVRKLEHKFGAHYRRWVDEDLAGKKLLLWGEQGIGDIIMFAGFVPWLLAQEVKLSVLVTPKLKPIFARSFPEAEILESLTLESPEKMRGRYDYHFPIGDLMQKTLPIYRPADHKAFLKADMERSSQLRQRYLAQAAAHGRKRLIGMCWHTTNAEVGFVRNVPLAEWAPLFSLPGIQFVSLQYGDHAAEIAAANRQFSNILLQDQSIDAFDDIEGLAAEIMAMDEIITTTNAGAHLAGALGAPTTLLIPARPDWRWGLAGGGNCWYASVTLERQERLLSWQAAMKRQRARLLAVSQ